MFTSVSDLIAVFRLPGAEPTDKMLDGSRLIGELGETADVGGHLWAKISILDDGEPAPEGWIPAGLIVRNFVPPLLPVDRAVFVEDCLFAARRLGVNTHFLAAWAQLETGIANVIQKVAGEARVGPFQFSLATWDAHRNSPGHGIKYERSRIILPDCQCDIAAVMMRRTIEAFKHANAEKPPLADQLLLALRIGVAAVVAALRLGNAASISDALGEAVPDGEDKVAAVRKALEQNADILTQGGIAGTPLTVAKVFEKIDQRLNTALTEARALIAGIDPELLPRADTPSESSTGSIALRYSRTPGDQHVYGHLILRMQEALSRANGTPVSADMRFGENTAEALNQWHQKNGRKTRDRINTEEWSALTGLPAPSLRDFCFQLTALFEGHGFSDEVNGAVDAGLITWGYNGFTFRFGHIQEVIKLAEATNPQWLTEAFAERAQALRDILKRPLDPDQVNWAKMTVLDAGGALRPEWMESFKAFGRIDGVRNVQLKHCEAIWNDMTKRIERFSFTNRLTVALCYDIAVQNGAPRLSQLLGELPSPPPDEAIVRTTLAEKVAAVAKPRKKIIAAGGGRKGTGGTFFRLEHWGLIVDEDEDELNEQPGTEPADNQDFAGFLTASLPELAGFFSPKEFLFKGGNASGHNTDPPKKLWKNILPTASVILRFRKQLPAGQIVRFNSVYRSPTYNKEIGGAKGSLHMQFNAIDFRVEGPGAGKPSAWARVLKDMRSAGEFKGGIGLYGSFVHVDTRGENTNF